MGAPRVWTRPTLLQDPTALLDYGNLMCSREGHGRLRLASGSTPRSARQRQGAPRPSRLSARRRGFLNFIPAASIEGLRLGFIETGAKSSHQTVLFDQLMDSNPLYLTGNTHTVRCFGLEADGPTVLEIPPDSATRLQSGTAKGQAGLQGVPAEQGEATAQDGVHQWIEAPDQHHPRERLRVLSGDRSRDRRRLTVRHCVRRLVRAAVRQRQFLQAEHPGECPCEKLPVGGAVRSADAIGAADQSAFPQQEHQRDKLVTNADASVDLYFGPKHLPSRRPTGSPPCRKRAGSSASAFTVRSNLGSIRPGGQAKSL